MAIANVDRLKQQARAILNKRILDKTIDPLTKDADGNPIMFPLHEGQEEVLSEFGVILSQWIVSSNRSGKSIYAAWLIAKLLKNDFTQVKRPDKWKDDGALMACLSQTRQQFDEDIGRYILAYYGPNYDEELHVRRDKYIYSITHRKTGNKLIAASFDNEQAARKRVQGLTLNFLLVNEMPKDANFVAELHMRLSTTGGSFLAAFTPLVVSPAIKNMVEASDGIHSKKYKWNIRMNPKFKDEETYQRLVRDMQHLSETDRNARLFGEWAQHDLSVYHFNKQQHAVKIPEEYNAKDWRHVVSVDPASASSIGLCVFAEVPGGEYWFLVEAYKFAANDIAPSDLVWEVERRIAQYNIVLRVSDSGGINKAFTAEATKAGIKYKVPYDKNGRRDEMIGKIRDKLGKDLFINEALQDFEDEIMSYRWTENDPTKIVQSKTFHIMDAFRYGVDCLPKPEYKPPELTTHERIKLIHWENVQKEYKKKEIEAKLGRTGTMRLMARIKRNQRRRRR